MKIPKKYKEKVESFKKCDTTFSEAKYEIELSDGYIYEDSGTHYTDTYKEALEIMRYAKKEI